MENSIVGLEWIGVMKWLHSSVYSSLNPISTSDSVRMEYRLNELRSIENVMTDSKKFSDRLLRGKNFITRASIS